MESSRYKSPWAALLWSMTLPGFGQAYNGNYVMGFIFVVAELMVNNMSNLNLSFLYTLHGDFNQSHEVVDFQWGMFYPSLWGFGMWQAFNKAKMINHHLKEKGVVPPTKKSYLTGFLFGLVCGMDIGLFLHFLFGSPIITGLICGLIGAISGHLIEKFILARLNTD